MQGVQQCATMMYLSGLVGFLLVVTAEARVGNSSELSFCTETEQCLLFDLICKTTDYEVRFYNSVKWVITEESSYFMEFAAMRAFKRLYRYISGDNENGEKIAMTAPVFIKMPEGLRFWQTGVYTMGFLLPVEHQKMPPKPTDDKVTIYQMPKLRVYVRSFGGWMMSGPEKENAKELSSDLNKVGAKYKKDFHYAAGYNSPMSLFKRHNEVWFVVEDEPECSSSSEEVDLSLFS